MQAFAQLYSELDASTSTQHKVQALTQFLSRTSAPDAAWAIYFLAGGRPRKLVSTRVLRQVASAVAGLPDWLFEESYQAVGDLAETIAHVLPPASRTHALSLAQWMEQRLLPLAALTPEQLPTVLQDYWSELDQQERFLMLKLIGGGFRVGVSRLLVIRALAQYCDLDSALIAQRMVGYTQQLPSPQRYIALVAQQGEPEAGHPYPFFLAHSFAASPETLGVVNDWLAEWKWDGIRAQVVKRAGQYWIWSRGEELMTERFPELQTLQHLPDGTVLDGELLVWHDTGPAPFAQLQTRITRKTLGKKIISQCPVIFMAYDLLEYNAHDSRHLPQQQRRLQLEQLLESCPAAGVQLSEIVQASSWLDLSRWREKSRERGVEGLMLKHKQSAYGIGRTKQSGYWLKWKVEPYTIDAVLIYAQAGHGRRASLYTDYTFALWRNTAEGQRELVPFAKAYSGLTDAEIQWVDRQIRQNTREKFGPVRSVTPALVMELGFEGLQRSSRHKSGVAVRFPRILRLRHDKTVEQADELDTLFALIKT
ncbi:MAG: ATP-dependent DNA ligase [Burkholderiales bacterium]